jgi:hypothetical protein
MSLRALPSAGSGQVLQSSPAYGLIASAINPPRNDNPAGFTLRCIKNQEGRKKEFTLSEANVPNMTS